VIIVFSESKPGNSTSPALLPAHRAHHDRCVAPFFGPTLGSLAILPEQLATCGGSETPMGNFPTVGKQKTKKSPAIPTLNPQIRLLDGLETKPNISPEPTQ